MRASGLPAIDILRPASRPLRKRQLRQRRLVRVELDGRDADVCQRPAADAVRGDVLAQVQENVARHNAAHHLRVAREDVLEHGVLRRDEYVEQNGREAGAADRKYGEVSTWLDG